MLTYDEFKAAFMSKKDLAKRLDAEVDTALDKLKAARDFVDQVAEADRADAARRLDDLESQVVAQVTVGATAPGEAWVAVRALQKPIDVEAQRLAAEASDAAMDTSEWLATIRRTLASAQTLCQDVRKDKARQPLLAEVASLGQKVDAVAGEDDRDAKAKRKKAPTVKQLAEAKAKKVASLKQLRTESRELLDQVRDAAGKPKQPKTQAALSGALVRDMNTIPAIADRLSSTARDPQGRTAAEDVAGRLAIFDEHLAADPKKGPDAARRNKAMRLAAITSVTATRMASDLNDPYLVGRIGQSLVDEYAPEMGAVLSRGDKDEDEADGALQLAQALVMDDPIGKLMFGRIDPADAVQRIRDMAEVAGEPPSVMLNLLRQQFEMKIGSLNRGQVKAGEKKDDVGADGNFTLATITGELSVGQFGAMVEHTGTGATDSPRWKDDGSGLDFKAASGQTHAVVAGDTLGKLAQTYYGDKTAFERIAFSNLTVLVRKPNPKKGGPELVERKSLRGVGADEPLPVGAVLTVPSKVSVLDQLEPYVAAWDQPEPGAGEQPAGSSDPTEQRPGKMSKRQRKKAAAAAPLSAITPDMLKAGAASLQSPRDSKPKYTDKDKAVAAASGRSLTDEPPTYIQAPGLGQAHKVRAPLDNAPAKADPLHGQINERQYAHLRLLARADNEDREAILAKTGKSVEDTVVAKLKEQYKPIDDAKARRIAANVASWIGKVPLTVTFKADSLFSDASKDAPAHGEKYKSEVVYSRGEKGKKDVIGRDEQGAGKMGTQGGNEKATGWKARGENYMRWRRDKDAREGRNDELAYEDQQIFGAANPTFDKGKGSVAEKPDEFGTNYYGDAHFLLKNDVRNRCAFAIRSKEKTAPLQRQDPGLVVYDILTGSTDGSLLFMDALLQMENRTDAITLPGLTWEVHLYGGFDCSKDAAEIYLSSGIDPAAANRIKAFAAKVGIPCKDIGAKPSSLDAQAKQAPKQIDLSQF
jgi:hypothetical protein